MTGTDSIVYFLKGVQMINDLLLSSKIELSRTFLHSEIREFKVTDYVVCEPNLRKDYTPQDKVIIWGKTEDNTYIKIKCVFKTDVIASELETFTEGTVIGVVFSYKNDIDFNRFLEDDVVKPIDVKSYEEFKGRVVITSEDDVKYLTIHTNYNDCKSPMRISYLDGMEIMYPSDFNNFIGIAKEQGYFSEFDNESELSKFAAYDTENSYQVYKSKLEELEPTNVYIMPKQHLCNLGEGWSTVHAYDPETKKIEPVDLWDPDKPLKLKLNAYSYKLRNYVDGFGRRAPDVTFKCESDVAEAIINNSGVTKVTEFSNKIIGELTLTVEYISDLIKILRINSKAVNEPVENFTMDFIKEKLIPIGDISGGLLVRYRVGKEDDTCNYDHIRAGHVYPFIDCKTGELSWFIAYIDHHKLGANEYLTAKRYNPKEAEDE